MKYQDELEVALKAVRSASRLCRSVQSTLGNAELKKEDRSPVTVADFGSQALVCRFLAEAYPEDPVIAEEDSAVLRDSDNRAILDRVVREVHRQTGEEDPEEVCRWIDRGNAHRYSERFWALDPIDGTKGFLRGDQYAVALALVVGGEIEVAALACPRLPDDAVGDGEAGVVFGAARSSGAFRAAISGSGVRHAVHVRPVSEGREARFCESFESAHSSHEDAAAVAEMLGIRRDPLRIDSQAKYGVVARGDADIYLRLTTHTGYVEKIWDHAAGALIVEEAGGKVTDLHGAKLDFSRGSTLDANVGIVATNGLLHEEVLTALGQVVTTR